MNIKAEIYCLSLYVCIAGLHPQSPGRFAQKPPAQVSHNLQSSYCSHMIAATM